MTLYAHGNTWDEAMAAMDPVVCAQESEHDSRDPNCEGLDYGPAECAGCTRPIHGGPDYCIECGSARGGRR